MIPIPRLSANRSTWIPYSRGAIICIASRSVQLESRYNAVFAVLIVYLRKSSTYTGYLLWRAFRAVLFPQAEILTRLSYFMDGSLMIE